MKTKAILFTSLVALLSSPGLAIAPSKQRSAEKVYCIKYERETGSRIARQDCLTKKQWAEQGVDVDYVTKK